MRRVVEETWGRWDEGIQRNFYSQYFTPANVQIAVIDGNAVGMIEVQRRPTEFYLARIEVTPAWQRQGIGSALIRALLAEAARHHLSVCLQVLRVNQARALYERLGFKVTGDTPTHWQMRCHPAANSPPASV